VPAVLSVVAGRLATLDASAADALGVAAVAGDPFDVRLVGACLPGGVPAAVDGVEAGAEAALLVPDGADPARYRFAHALLRDGVLASLSPARRLELHRRLGGAVESDPSLASAVVGARHLLAAAPLGDVDRAVAHAVAAAAEARASYAFEDAVELLEGVRALPLTAGQRAEVLVGLGDALRGCGRTGDAWLAYRAGADAAREAGAGRFLGEAALGATRGWSAASQWRGDDDRKALLDEAVAVVAEPLLRIRLLGERALWTQQPERRQALASDALALVASDGSSAALRAGYAANLVARWSPLDTATRLAYADRLLAEGLADVREAITVRLDRLADLLRAGDRAGFDAERSALADDVVRVGDRRPRWALATFEHLVCAVEGRWDDARSAADAALAVWDGEPEPDAVTTHLAQHAVAAYHLGDPSELVAVGELGVAVYPDVPAYRCALLWGLSVSGDLDRARPVLDEVATGEWSGLPRDSGHAAAVQAVAESVAVLGDRERAASLLELAAPYEDHVAVLSGLSMYFGPVASGLARLAGTVGRRAAAERYAAVAAELARRIRAG
jgi:hypothetical protein